MARGRYFTDSPWALLPSARFGVADALVKDPPPLAVSGGVLEVRGEVAVVPVHGVIFPRGDVMGGVGLDRLGRHVRALASDDRIGAIVLDIDSPGGSVAGVTELAALLREAREQKPLVAVANHTMASAGYWIGAQATTVVASPSARVGSVGVYSMHTDISAALEREGVRHTLVSAGEFKTEGNHLEPLDNDALEQIQATVDEAAAMFHADLALGRNVGPAKVAERFGGGRMFGADGARAAGMIDRVATLDETINWLGYFHSPKSAATRKRYRAAERALRVGRAR
jgi:signal peptide peptidase SppA